MSQIRQPRLAQVSFLTAFWILVALILLVRALSARFSHDEYQFVASGQIFARNFLLPYRDYPFLHMPYMPFVNGVLFLLTGGSLLSARLLNELFFFASAVLLFILVQRASGRRGLTWAGIGAGSIAAGLMVFNPSFMDMDGRAFNHALPTFLGLLAYFFYVRSSQIESPSRTRIWLAASGAAVGLAAGVRLSFVVMALPFLAGVILWPSKDGFKQRLLSGLVFGLGMAGGLLPAAILFWLAPQQAYYGNLLYIQLNTIYRENMAFPTAMSAPQKLGFFISTVLKTPSGFSLYFLFMVSLGAAAWAQQRKNLQIRPEILVASGLMLVLLAAGFAPTPLWSQYFFAPVPFLLLALAYTLPALGRLPRLAAAGVLGALLVFSAAGQSSSLLTALANPQDWTTTQAASQAQALLAAVPSGRVLTLAPIIPLEAGLDTYAMFAVGPFAWRTASILLPTERTLFGVVGPDELETYLAQDAPAAILTGPEQIYDGVTSNDSQRLEYPMTQFAQIHGYRPQSFPCTLFSECTLWLK